jgi:hypothetical protein
VGDQQIVIKIIKFSIKNGLAYKLVHFLFKNFQGIGELNVQEMRNDNYGAKLIFPAFPAGMPYS